MVTKKQLLQRIQQTKRRIAAEWDKLRDLIGELDQIADDCDEAAEKPKLAITMEGGIIQSAFSNTPIEFSVIDYDTDGADEDELSLVPQNDGRMEEAYFHQPHIAIMPEEFTGRLANIKPFKSEEEEP